MPPRRRPRATPPSPVTGAAARREGVAEASAAAAARGWASGCRLIDGKVTAGRTDASANIIRSVKLYWLNRLKTLSVALPDILCHIMVPLYFVQMSKGGFSDRYY